MAERIPDDCLPPPQAEPRTRLVAYCIEPGCKCLDRAGVIVQSHDEAPRGYEVREEI